MKRLVSISPVAALADEVIFTASHGGDRIAPVAGD
jgi:hypothetical protein